VTLTATESAADGTTPAGTVQFGVASTDIGAPVAVGAAGVATTTATFTDAIAEPVWALFLPANLTYATSEGTLSLNLMGTAGSVLIGVTVPPSGALTVTVIPGALTLAEQGTLPVTATGILNTVIVDDSRNTYPGWSVSGQQSAFTGSGGTIAGDELGWVPTAITPLVAGAALGPPVAPGTSPNGLGDTAQVLASAPAGQGFGTNRLSASLTLEIPNLTPAGSYTGSLSITYLTSQA